MNFREVRIHGTVLHALSSGALFWPGERLLVVSDLHLGKADRLARQPGGPLLPPYDVDATLSALETDVRATRPAHVICLGDSFDDDRAAADLGATARDRILSLQAGRAWTWIDGNHDPGGTAPGGTHVRELALGPLVFRHIAQASAVGEVSGHYHPKATVSGKAGRITRPCFLFDADRLILPAYGHYTGGLTWTHPAFAAVMQGEARAVLTGRVMAEIPHPTITA